MASTISGLRILVTGATSGVGEALVAKLAARGAEVLVHGRDGGRVAAVAEQSNIGEARRFVADLSRLAEAWQLGRAVAASGPLDVLVNNAASGSGESASCASSARTAWSFALRLTSWLRSCSRSRCSHSARRVELW